MHSCLPLQCAKNFFPKELKRGLAKCKVLGSFLPRTAEPKQHMSELLDDDDLTSALKKCPEWEYEKKAITRTFEFEEFMDAIDFVDNLAEIADEAQHFPDILVRHTKVTVSLTTHDEGGVTNLDIELAQRVDYLFD